jgi:xanthine dehydrogenase iron-sulfur cluster and FAD-binding subunit A
MTTAWCSAPASAPVAWPPRPVRARKTEAALRGQPWTPATVMQPRVLRAEFQPISDMRASAAYRSEVLGNLLQRFWLESQGHSRSTWKASLWRGEPA